MEQAEADASDRGEDTLNSAPSIHSSLENEPHSLPSQADVSLQTGQSLLLDVVPVEEPVQPTKQKPAQLTKQTSTTQIPVSTASQTVTESKTLVSRDGETTQTQETIKIVKSSDGDHDVIEIATKNVPCNSSAEFIRREQSRSMPDDIVVDMKYQDAQKTESATSELNISHAAPQTFETFLTEPDDTTTEVVVDADGTKRIIVRKLRRTLVTSQQTTQQHFSTLSTSVDGNPPVTQAFSEATMRGQQVTVTRSKPDGTVELSTTQSYGGRVTTGAPGGEINVEEFETGPQHSHQIIQGNIQDLSLKPLEGEPSTVESGEYQTTTSSVHAVVQQVTRRVIRRTRRIIRKTIIIDGKETTTEEVIEEPEEVEIDEQDIPHISINVTRNDNEKIIDNIALAATQGTDGIEKTIVSTQTDVQAPQEPLREGTVPLTPGSPMQGPFFGPFAKDMTPKPSFTDTTRRTTITEIKPDEKTVEIISDESLKEDEGIVQSRPETSADVKSLIVESERTETPGEVITHISKITIPEKHAMEYFPIEVKSAEEQPNGLSQLLIKTENCEILQTPIDDLSIGDSKTEPSFESTIPEDVVFAQSKCKSETSSKGDSQIEKLESGTVEIVEHAGSSTVEDFNKPSIPVPEETKRDEPARIDTEKEKTTEKQPDIPTLEESRPKSETVIVKLTETESLAIEPIETVHQIPESPKVLESTTPLVTETEPEQDIPKAEDQKQDQATTEIIVASELPDREKEMFTYQIITEHKSKGIEDFLAGERADALKDPQLSSVSCGSEYKPVVEKVEISLSLQQKDDETGSSVFVKTEAERPQVAPYHITKEDVDINLPAEKETIQIIHNKVVQTSDLPETAEKETETNYEPSEKSESDGTTSRKIRKKKKHKNKTETPEKSVTEDSSASISTTIADSTDINVPMTDSSKHESEQPQPDLKDITEPSSLISTFRDDHSDPDHGYEPDDKTTVDELSLADDEECGRKKNKKKKKKKQKVRTKHEDASEIPKTTTDEADFTDETLPADEENDKTDKKAKKRKQKKEESPVLEDVVETKPEEPQTLRTEIHTQTVVETCDVGAGITSPEVPQIVTSTAQTSPEPAADNKEQEIQTEKSTEINIEIQTSPKPAVDSSNQTSQLETENLAMQTITPVLTPTEDDEVQTSPVQEEKPKIDETFVQTSPIQVEKTVIEETYVQTSPIEPEKPLIEETYAQTSPIEPEKQILEETFVQTSPVEPEKPEVEETPSQTSPVQPEKPAIEDHSMQTSPVQPDKPVIEETYVQTSPIEPEKPTVEETYMQTSPIQPDVPEVEETYIQTSPIEPERPELEDVCVQTSPIEPEKTEIENVEVQTITAEVITIESQTSPIQGEPTTEIETQTSSPEPKATLEDAVQQTSPLPDETKAILQEATMQTITPEPIATTEIEIQTSAIPIPETPALEDSTMQTEVPEQKQIDTSETQTTPKSSPRLVVTSDVEMQTKSPEPTIESDVQTSAVQSPEPAEVPQSIIQTTTEKIVTTAEGESQTIEPKKLEVSDSSIQTKERELVPTSEEGAQAVPITTEISAQTSSPEKSVVVEEPVVAKPEPIEVVTPNIVPEIEPVVQQPEGDSLTDTSYEIHVHATIEIPESASQSFLDSERASITETWQDTSITEELSENVISLEDETTRLGKRQHRKRKHKTSEIREQIPSTNKEKTDLGTIFGQPVTSHESLPKLSYSDVARKNSDQTRSMSPPDSSEEFLVREEPGSIVVGKVLTDLDINTIRVQGKTVKRTDDGANMITSKVTISKVKSSDPNVEHVQVVAVTEEPSTHREHPSKTRKEDLKPTKSAEPSSFSSYSSIKDVSVKPTTTQDSSQIHIDTRQPLKEAISIVTAPEPMDTTEEPLSPTESVLTKKPGSLTKVEIKSYAETLSDQRSPKISTPPSPRYEIRDTSPTWEDRLLTSHSPVRKTPSPTTLLLAEALEYGVPQNQVSQRTRATKVIADRVRNSQNAKQTSHLSNILYIATLDQVITNESVDELSGTVQRGLGQLRVAVAESDTVIIKHTLITVVETISTWLESVEYRIFLSRESPHGPSHDDLRTFIELKEEINHVEESVRELDSIWKNVEVHYEDEDRNRIMECLGALESQVQAIENITDDGEKYATTELIRWDEFLNGINNISRLVDEQRKHLDNMIESDASTQWKLEELEQIDNTNRNHMWKTGKLVATARTILSEYPGKVVPEEAYAAHEMTRVIEYTICIERDRLVQLLSLAEEYEQTLQEFAQITEIAENLLDSPISVASLEDLQEEMQKHRKFFVNLNHCRAILESLEDNLDRETRAKHSELHEKLHRKATTLLNQAACRSQQMSLAASRWIILEQGVKEERGWLGVAHQRVPDLQTVTSSDYEQYISLYQVRIERVDNLGSMY